MSLPAGTLLGPYQIVALLGSGGMGEVYRARDARLRREVALKIITDALPMDAGRIARFEQEARAAAAITHANLVAVFDVGESEFGPFIVSELLDGETLRARLARGRIAPRTACEIGAQLARGLAAAHDKGVVHRDLKPDNIFLTSDGVAKILDFGVAKLRMDPRESLSAESATITADAVVTEPGVVLGTVGYMAPEQVRGHLVDHRADIFSIGCVLYEMFHGKRAFAGSSQIETLHAILNADPAESDSTDISPSADRLVRMCLEKDPTRRFQSARDLAFALETIPLSSGAVQTVTKRRGRAATVGAALAILVAAAAVWRATAPDARSSPQLRFEIETPAGRGENQLALSPTGSHLVTVAGALWLRPLNSWTGTLLKATDDASWPFWAPDERAIGFFSGGKLKRISVADGAITTLADAPVGTGGSWNGADVVIFAPLNAGPLFSVPAQGGAARQITELNAQRGELAHRHPQFLPDGRHFIYTAISKDPQSTGVYVASLDDAAGKFLVGTRLKALFAPPDSLLFVREAALLAQPFNPDRLELSGEPRVIGEPVGAFVSSSAAGIAASNQGMLAFRLNTSFGAPERTLEWLDRRGEPAGPLNLRGPYQRPSLSHDGRTAAIGKAPVVSVFERRVDLWLIDLERGTERVFTANGRDGQWSPDGRQIAFTRDNGNVADLYVRSVDGSIPEEHILSTDLGKAATDWSPDGGMLMYRTNDSKNQSDLWIVTVAGSRQARPVVGSPFNEFHGHFSPDARWIAYTSMASGREEIYIAPFERPGRAVQISQTGGTEPRWGAGELLFINGTTVMATKVDLDGGEIKAAVPHRLFDVGAPFQWDVSRDGQRFLIAAVDAAATPQPSGLVRVVANWSGQ